MEGSEAWAETLATQAPFWLPSCEVFLDLSAFFSLRRIANTFRTAAACGRFLRSVWRGK